MDLASGTVHRDGERTQLTTKERGLLLHLADRAGDVVQTEELLVEVWGYSPSVASRAVANAMLRLRRKVEVDPADPDHLFTVYGEGFRFEPLRVQLSATTALVGRERELKTLSKLLSSGARLVTVVGIGGIGKTTLVQQLVSPRGARSAVLEDQEEVAAAVAHQLGDADEAALLRRLRRSGPTLLVLDNLERVHQRAGRVLTRWLRELPELQVVATSRIPLNIEGEHRLILGPVSSHTAAEIFLVRARTSWPEVEDSPALRELLDHLDRVPLAIELAAARADVCGLDDLRERTSGGALEGSARGGMHDTLVWSINALEDEDARALARCTGFAGDFSVDAAEAAAGSLGSLQRLLGAGLVQRVNRGDRVRFRLLRLVRQAVLDTGGPVPGLAALVAWLEAELHRQTDLDAFFLEEREHFLTACRFAPAPEAVSLMAFVGDQLLQTGPKGELSALLDHFLARGVQTPEMHVLRGRLAIREGDLDEAEAAYTRAEEGGLDVRVWQFGVWRRQRLPCDELIGRALPDPQVHRHCAVSLRNAGRLNEAEAWARSALELADRDIEVVNSLALLANICSRQGRRREAAVFLEQALDVAGPDSPISAAAVGNLAVNELLGRQPARAADFAARAARLARLRGSRRDLVVALHNQACAHVDLGKADLGKHFATRALAEGEPGTPHFTVTTAVLASALHLEGELTEAAEVAEQALEQDPSLAAAQVIAARIYAEAGDAERALALAPQDVWTQRWLERAGGGTVKPPPWGFPGDTAIWRAASKRVLPA